ncbi:hypothetical protein MJO28_009774 [Puccinia striiformis f. sp. tritici]|uniref:Uncharacterized protein n=1 Tax=Puccinia striiformis f. sp. tritici TaxID=168172 RepID=A0ACC0E829_9BASI|nr:hypothetical protein MJO28_009774 [Puccinia striiformis f. sp. tritici]
MAVATTTSTPVSPLPHSHPSCSDMAHVNEERMQQVLPKLFIGDLTAAQTLKTLQDPQIRNVVSVRISNYPHHPGFDHLSVPVDDTECTNIGEWFASVAIWIQARLDDPNRCGVLIHCVAVIFTPRNAQSTTLLAAYLMKAYRLTTDGRCFIPIELKDIMKTRNLTIKSCTLFLFCWNEFRRDRIHRIKKTTHMTK